MCYEVSFGVYLCPSGLSMIYFSLGSGGAIGLLVLYLLLVDFCVSKLVCGGFLSALLDEATGGTKIDLHVPLRHLP